MFDLDGYLSDLVSKCRTHFGDRLLYVGLQGSFLRGEAHESSDIDVMVILDRFSIQDMDQYREILKKIGFCEKSCGFICGREEMARWNPLEVFHLRHTTKDLYGVLTDYLPSATREDEVNYVKVSLGNLYHELCHRYIHAERDKKRCEVPRHLQRSVFPDTEFALSGERPLYPHKKRAQGSCFSGRPTGAGAGRAARRI